MKDEKYAYVTLATDTKFLYWATFLQASLRICNSKYPLIVMITKELENNYLLKYFDKYEIIPFYQFNANSLIKHYKNTINKFYAYNFIQYDKLIFLDADLILVKNIDNLFLTNVNFVCATYTPKRLNITHCPLNGCMLFTPNKDTYDLIMQTVNNDNELYVDDESVVYYLLYPYQFQNQKWDNNCSTYEALKLVNGDIIFTHDKHIYQYNIYNAQELEKYFANHSDKFFNYLLELYQLMYQYTKRQKCSRDDVLRDWQTYGSLKHYNSKDIK